MLRGLVETGQPIRVGSLARFAERSKQLGGRERRLAALLRLSLLAHVRMPPHAALPGNASVRSHSGRVLSKGAGTRQTNLRSSRRRPVLAPFRADHALDGLQVAQDVLQLI